MRLIVSVSDRLMGCACMVRSTMRGEHAIKVVRPVAIREVIRFRTHWGASHISLIKTRDIAEILAERRPIAPSPEFLPQAPSGTR